MANQDRLFIALAERAHKENDLSDVTYAMCEADSKFKQFFIDFFFADAHLDAKKVTIEREHTDILGRPDFWIRTSTHELFIVEVKIGDCNQHFEQYYEILKATNTMVENDRDVWRRLGYIANYKSVKELVISGEKVKDLCAVATWREFVNALERYQCFDDSTIQAYVKYVRSVCPFDDYSIDDRWIISIDDFRAIKKFANNVSSVIDGADGCKQYETVRKFCSQKWMGQYFEWKIGGKGLLAGKTVWGWLGVYYRSQGAVVCVEFENREGWGAEVCSLYEHDLSDGRLILYAKDSNKVACDGLKTFFENVLKSIMEHAIVSDGNSQFCTKEEMISGYSRELLAMKSLPYMLENHFLTDEFLSKMRNNGYEIVITSGKDEEEPSGHCGRYFELKENKQGTKNAKKYTGWIGVNYNDDCCRVGKKDDDFGTSPAFVIDIEKEFPGGTTWQEDTWGWKFAEIDCAGTWHDVLKRARQCLLKLSKQ